MNCLWRRLNWYWQVFKLELEIAEADYLIARYCANGLSVTAIHMQMLVLQAKRDQILRRLLRVAS